MRIVLTVMRRRIRSASAWASGGMGAAGSAGIGVFPSRRLIGMMTATPKPIAICTIPRDTSTSCPLGNPAMTPKSVPNRRNM